MPNEGYPDIMRGSRQRAVRQQLHTALKQIKGNTKIIEKYTATDNNASAFFDYVFICGAGVFLIQICDDRPSGRNAIEELRERESKLDENQYVLSNSLQQFTDLKAYSLLVYPDEFGIPYIRPEGLERVVEASELQAKIKYIIKESPKALNKFDVEKTYVTFLQCSDDHQSESEEFLNRKARKNTVKRALRLLRFIIPIFVITLLILMNLDAITDAVTGFFDKLALKATLNTNTVNKSIGSIFKNVRLPNIFR